MSDFAYGVIAGFLMAGTFRLTFGTVVLRENGRWMFKVRRFDDPPHPADEGSET